MRGATWRPDCGSRPRRGAFQPTRPLRGATSEFLTPIEGVPISTHAPLAGRDIKRTGIKTKEKISTHAPLAGRDDIGHLLFFSMDNFNPRAPCGARHVAALRAVRPDQQFQPTRPLRGATREYQEYAKMDIFQPTRPLRGATMLQRKNGLLLSNFNPRAPCGARQQKSTNHYAHFCDNRQISDAFAQNAACQGILLLFDAGKPCGFWVRTAQVISAHLCFAL